MIKGEYDEKNITFTLVIGVLADGSLLVSYSMQSSKVNDLNTEEFKECISGNELVYIDSNVLTVVQEDATKVE